MVLQITLAIQGRMVPKFRDIEAPSSNETFGWISRGFTVFKGNRFLVEIFNILEDLFAKIVLFFAANVVPNQNHSFEHVFFSSTPGSMSRQCYGFQR